MIEKEVWKDIADFEGKYQVSNLGKIKSLNYNNTGKEQILIPGKSKTGYLLVLLSKNCIRKFFYIHRLVAQAFIDNPDDLPFVNHKDEDKTNNRVDNLEWCDAKYNTNYGNAIERRVKTFTDKRPNIMQFTLDGKFVNEYPSIKEAERCLGIQQGNICSCCKGRRLTAGGYIWKFKNNE